MLSSIGLTCIPFGISPVLATCLSPKPRACSKAQQPMHAQSQDINFCTDLLLPAGCFLLISCVISACVYLSSEYCRRLAAPKEIKPHGIQVCLVAEMLFSIFVLQLFCSSHELFLFFRVGRQNRPSSPDWPKTWRHRRECSGIWARIRLSAVFPTSFPKLKCKKSSRT